jgi:hypothetical protein
MKGSSTTNALQANLHACCPIMDRHVHFQLLYALVFMNIHVMRARAWPKRQQEFCRCHATCFDGFDNKKVIDHSEDSCILVHACNIISEPLLPHPLRKFPASATSVQSHTHTKIHANNGHNRSFYIHNTNVQIVLTEWRELPLQVLWRWRE